MLGWGPLLGWRGRCIFHGEPPPAPLPRRVGLGRRVLPPAAGRETQCVGIHLHSHTWKGFWEKKELGRSRQRQELLFFLQGLDESGREWREQPLKTPGWKRLRRPPHGASSQPSARRPRGFINLLPSGANTEVCVFEE